MGGRALAADVCWENDGMGGGARQGARPPIIGRSFSQFVFFCGFPRVDSVPAAQRVEQRAHRGRRWNDGRTVAVPPASRRGAGCRGGGGASGCGGNCGCCSCLRFCSQTPLWREGCLEGTRRSLKKRTRDGRGPDAGRVRAVPFPPSVGPLMYGRKRRRCRGKLVETGTAVGKKTVGRKDTIKLGRLAAPQAPPEWKMVKKMGMRHRSLVITQLNKFRGGRWQGGGTDRRGGGTGPVFLSPLVVPTAALARKALRRSLCPCKPA
eukprot:gene12787-biopygen16962